MKREPIKDYAEWLDSNPEFEGENKEVFENADGSQYIPVAIVEGLLDWLTDIHWNTLQSVVYLSKDKDNEEFVSGSLMLEVWINDLPIRRIGASTMYLKEFKAKSIDEKDNTQYESTIISLALCNAAKKLGNRFGRSLNGRGVNKLQEDKKESLSEIEIEIEKVCTLILEGKTYDNAMYLLSEVYPHLKNNFALKTLAESLKK